MLQNIYLMQHVGCNGPIPIDSPSKRANFRGMLEPVRTNWLLIAAIFTAGLFAAAQFGKLTLTLQVMQNTYPSASAWVPSLVSIVGIVGLIFGVIAGPFIARIGLERILLMSLLVGSSMSLVQAFLPPIEIFALTRIVEGFSHLGIVISGPTLIIKASADADRPVTMGIWAAFFGASLAIMAFFLPAILTSGGVPLLFALHGVGMLAICGVLTKLLPRVAPEPVASHGVIDAYRKLYSTPNLLLPGAGFVWYTAIYIALIAVLPIALDLPTSTITIIPLVSIAGTLGAGFIAKITGPHHVSNIGFVSSALLMILIWTGMDQAIVIYALFLLMGAVPTGAFASISHFNPTTGGQASATGGVTHFGNIGTTLGTPVMVLAHQWAGLTGIMVMVLVCCLGGLVSILTLTRINR